MCSVSVGRPDEDMLRTRTLLALQQWYLLQAQDGTSFLDLLGLEGRLKLVPWRSPYQTIEFSTVNFVGDILTYMIHSEGAKYPECLMHIFYLKCSGAPKNRNMLSISLRVCPALPYKDNNFQQRSIRSEELLLRFCRHSLLRRVCWVGMSRPGSGSPDQPNEGEACAQQHSKHYPCSKNITL